MSIISTFWRTMKASARRRIIIFAAVIALFSVPVPLTHNSTQEVSNMNHVYAQEDPSKFAKLLDTIAEGESKGNYNAYFGNVHNSAIDFTSMTINEVMSWQYDYVKKGSKSSAVGKYQIIRPTLATLVKDHKLDTNVRFDEKTQDTLAVSLLKKRGLDSYASGKMNRKTFAYNLSKEWAALPKTIGKEPQKSYYAGDGLNKALVSVEKIDEGIKSIKTGS